MINIVKGDQHILLSFNETSLTLSLLDEVRNELIDLNENIILDLSSFNVVENHVIEELNNFARSTKEAKRSFIGYPCDCVIATKAITFECFPTKTEAQDVLFIEIVERELDGE